MVSDTGPTLRFAGTLEIAGLDFSINQRRVSAIRRAAPRYLPGMENLETLEVWGGLRPCTPDGLPLLGRPPQYENLIIAAGHAMIGMSLGPITGKLVAQIACGETPELDLTSLRPDRF
jgi:D-amino-acid dehydrogenase